MQYNQDLVLDTVHINDGYFSAKSSSSAKQKLRVSKDGQTLTYNISNKFETFPLQLGSGQYTINLYRNVAGTKYTINGRILLNVSLKNEQGPYLHSNQYVRYETTDPCVKEASKYKNLSDKEKIESVKKYISDYFMYDYVRSFLVTDGQLPDISKCFEKKMGICQDLAALVAAMLRSIGVPCKLVIGYTDKKQYHAWNEIYIGGKWEIYDPTMAVNNDKRSKKYSKERWY